MTGQRKKSVPNIVPCIHLCFPKNKYSLLFQKKVFSVKHNVGV